MARPVCVLLGLSVQVLLHLVELLFRYLAPCVPASQYLLAAPAIAPAATVAAAASPSPAPEERADDEECDQDEEQEAEREEEERTCVVIVRDGSERSPR